MDIRAVFDSEVGEFKRKLAVENVSTITISNYVFSLERVFAFTKTPLSQLKLRQIEDYTLQLKDSHNMGTLKLDLYTLRKYFKHRNPKLCNQIVVPKTVDTSGLVKPTARKEHLDFLMNAKLFKDEWKDKQLKIALLVFFNTGCRRKSLVNVRVEDIDFKKKEISFLWMKEGNPITNTLSDYTLSKIKEYLSNRGVKSKWLLCDKEGNQIEGRVLTDEMRDIRKNLKLSDKITPHSFRRGSFTDMVDAGENPAEIAKAHGVTINQVLRYASAMNMKKIKAFQSKRL